MYYQLTNRFHVAAPLERVWAFFSTAENLPKITPQWLNFTVDTAGPITVAEDTVLDYRIRWAGLSIKWRTRIIDWSPPRQFIDLQIRGPYALWHHQHTFEPVQDGVECGDRVIYRLPGGVLGRIGHAISVKRQLLEIFAYRRGVIARELGAVRLGGEDARIERID